METFQTHFGIAKALIEKYDCDPYALIVCSPKQKPFFENQKLIKFKKSWYLRDNVNLRNHKTNIKKLEKLEKQFSLNLKKIIYGDRFFYKYNKYYNFSDEEIFSIIEQELNFYNKLLDEIVPDYVLIRSPEFQDIELFYEICKAKKIKVLILYHSRFSDRWIISSNVDEQITLDNVNKNIQIKSFNELRKDGEEYSKLHDSTLTLQKSNIAQKINVLKELFSTFEKSNINNYRDVGKTPWTTIVQRIKLVSNSFFRQKYLDNNAKKQINFEPYAYFPLHYEPERTILRNGEFYTDQISVIRNISQSLPIEMNLLVKEHHAMKTFGWRNSDFYKKIEDMPKVKLIHPSVSNKTLMQNASIITTIAGSTAIEAMFYEKSSVVFSNMNCSALSCIFKINNLEELPNVIKKCINTKVDVRELNQYIDKLKKSSFSCDVFTLTTLASQIFGLGGFLDNNIICENKMKEFLEKFRNEFDTLATEHIKKIKQT
jgi:hypothetical protein